MFFSTTNIFSKMSKIFSKDAIFNHLNVFKDVIVNHHNIFKDVIFNNFNIFKYVIFNHLIIFKDVFVNALEVDIYFYIGLPPPQMEKGAYASYSRKSAGYRCWPQVTLVTSFEMI